MCTNANNCYEIRIPMWCWYYESTFYTSNSELGETIIGDLTQFQISNEEKETIEHNAVHKILSGLIDKDLI